MTTTSTEFVHTLTITKKSRSNQNIESSLKHDLTTTTTHTTSTTLQPQPTTTTNKRHSLSALVLRGKQPSSRSLDAATSSDKKTNNKKKEEKKGYFERRRERKLEKIEQKPVYKWNYKSLYKWLKYKGFEKKFARVLKKDRLNGYIMLSLELSDLISLDIPSEVAKTMLDLLIAVSERQDNLIDCSCECGELELPMHPVNSKSVFSNG